MSGRGQPQRGGRGQGDRGGFGGGRGRGGDGGGGGQFGGEQGLSYRGGRPDRGRPGGGRPGGGHTGGRYPPGGRDRPAAVPFRHPDGTAPVVSQRVEKVEEAYASKLVCPKGNKTPGIPKDGLMPLRPGYGTIGSLVVLWANYFELVIEGGEIFRYAITIKDKENKDVTLSTRKARWIVELLLEKHFATQRVHLATDYRSNLVSRFPLNPQTGPYDVVYRHEDENEPRTNPPPPVYKCTVLPTGTVNMSDLVDHLSSSRASELFKSKIDTINAMNLVVGQYSKANPNIASVGANKHYQLPGTNDTIDLGGGLKALRGFFVSARAATARVLLNVQVKNGAFYHDGSLHALINEFKRVPGSSMTRLDKFLSRLQITVPHLKKPGAKKDRTMTIAGLARMEDGRGLPHPPEVPKFGGDALEVRFWLTPKSDESKDGTPKGKGTKKGNPPLSVASADGGKYISVANYFKTRYQKTLQAPKQHVVNVGNRANPSYLPAEVCMVVSGQPAKSKLSPAQTQAMIRFAVRAPDKNANSIVVDGARILGITPDNNGILKKFGIKAEAKLIAVPGRILPFPQIAYLNGQASPFNGGWNLSKGVGKQATQYRVQPKNRVVNWAALWIRGTRDPWDKQQSYFMQTIEDFRKKARDIGVRSDGFLGTKVVDYGGPQDLHLVEDQLRPSTEATKKKPGLLLVILPWRDELIYNTVKHACDVKFGIVNVCSVASQMTKSDGQEQYFANEALKINLKLGGVNHRLVEQAKLGIVAEGQTMLVGLDVTHPAPGSAITSPSIAGMVASIDKHVAQFPAALCIQTKRRTEMVTKIEALIKSRLQTWMRYNNNGLPDNILVYRDGVSEGQFHLVLEEELPLLQKGCQAVYPATRKPRITIVIVGKRHHTRFYPTDTSLAKSAKNGNPKNGTVVDRQVTESRYWDFYLQAHHAIQGTARPAHYTVVHDEIFEQDKKRAGHQSAADALEELTHQLCYLYGRATKAVSICPPAYYADLVCERARCYLPRFYEGATPGTSVAGDGAGPRVAEDAEVEIHPDIADTMFYI